MNVLRLIAEFFTTKGERKVVFIQHKLQNVKSLFFWGSEK